MKRVLLVTACALICLAVLAGPAQAYTPEPNTAYVFVHDGSWFQVLPDGSLSADSFKAIPRSYDIVIYDGWLAVTRGRVASLPTSIQFTLDIPAAGFTMTMAQSASYWTPSEYVDTSKGSAFNPNIGAGLWASYWIVPLGHLAGGTYSAACTENWLHTLSDMFSARDGKPGVAVYGTQIEQLPFTFRVK